MFGAGGMGLGEKVLEAIAADDEVALVANDQIIAFELNEKFRHARARGAHQIGEVLVACSNGEAGAAFFYHTKIFAQFQQNQGEAFLERATHEVGATQLNEIPSTKVAGGHHFEIGGRDAERDFDKRFKSNRTDLTIGNRFATKVVADAGNRRWKTRNHSGRHHDYQDAIALAIAAGDSRDARQEDKGCVGRMPFVDNYFTLFNSAGGEGVGEAIELAR